MSNNFSYTRGSNNDNNNKQTAIAPLPSASPVPEGKQIEQQSSLAQLGIQLLSMMRGSVKLVPVQRAVETARLGLAQLTHDKLILQLPQLGQALPDDYIVATEKSREACMRTVEAAKSRLCVMAPDLENAINKKFQVLTSLTDEMVEGVKWTLTYRVKRTNKEAQECLNEQRKEIEEWITNAEEELRFEEPSDERQKQQRAWLRGELGRQKRTLERIKDTKVDLGAEAIVAHAMATDQQILAQRDQIEAELNLLGDAVSIYLRSVSQEAEMFVENVTLLPLMGQATDLQESRDLVLAQQVSNIIQLPAKQMANLQQDVDMASRVTAELGTEVCYMQDATAAQQAVLNKQMRSFQLAKLVDELYKRYYEHRRFIIGVGVTKAMEEAEAALKGVKEKVKELRKLKKLAKKAADEAKESQDDAEKAERAEQAEKAVQKAEEDEELKCYEICVEAANAAFDGTLAEKDLQWLLDVCDPIHRVLADPECPEDVKKLASDLQDQLWAIRATKTLDGPDPEQMQRTLVRILFGAWEELAQKMGIETDPCGKDQDQLVALVEDVCAERDRLERLRNVQQVENTKLANELSRLKRELKRLENEVLPNIPGMAELQEKKKRLGETHANCKKEWSTKRAELKRLPPGSKGRRAAQTAHDEAYNAMKAAWDALPTVDEEMEQLKQTNEDYRDYKAASAKQHEDYEAYMTRRAQQTEDYQALQRRIRLMPVQLVIYVYVPQDKRRQVMELYKQKRAQQEDIDKADRIWGALQEAGEVMKKGISTMGEILGLTTEFAKATGNTEMQELAQQVAEQVVKPVALQELPVEEPDQLLALAPMPVEQVVGPVGLKAFADEFAKDMQTWYERRTDERFCARPSNMDDFLVRFETAAKSLKAEMTEMAKAGNRDGIKAIRAQLTQLNVAIHGGGDVIGMKPTIVAVQDEFKLKGIPNNASARVAQRRWFKWVTRFGVIQQQLWAESSAANEKLRLQTPPGEEGGSAEGTGRGVPSSQVEVVNGTHPDGKSAKGQQAGRSPAKTKGRRDPVGDQAKYYAQEIRRKDPRGKRL